MDKKELRNKIADGYILVRVTFEIVGSPKEHVEKSLKAYLENLKKDSRIIFVKTEQGEAEETEGKLWSSFAETEVLIKSLDTLTWLSINFMPASIEVLEPENLSFKNRDLQNWLNDLLSKLHEVNVGIVALKSQKESLVLGMNTLIRNTIILCLDKAKTAKEIGDKIGIDSKQLAPFLEAMIKEKKLVKKDNLYSKPK